VGIKFELRRLIWVLEDGGGKKRTRRGRGKREESEPIGPNKAPKLEDDDFNASTPTTTKEESEAVATTNGFIHLVCHRAPRLMEA